LSHEALGHRNLCNTDQKHFPSKLEDIFNKIIVASE